MEQYLIILAILVFAATAGACILLRKRKRLTDAASERFVSTEQKIPAQQTTSLGDALQISRSEPETDVFGEMPGTVAISQPRVDLVIGSRPKRRIKKVAEYQRLLFLDTETTGLLPEDRLISLAIIALDAELYNDTQASFSFLHRIYNPERACHPQARRIHGYSNQILNKQRRFREEVDEVIAFLGTGALIVAHNASFDMRFLNRELSICGHPELRHPTFCTMLEYRRKKLGSSKLDEVIREVGMKRAGPHHGAFEDAWLAMNVFFWLKGMPLCPLPPETEGQSYALQNYVQ